MTQKRAKFTQCAVCHTVTPTRGMTVLYTEGEREVLACVEKGGPRCDQRCADSPRAQTLKQLAAFDAAKREHNAKLRADRKAGRITLDEYLAQER